jgi:hypothetical protein
MTDYTQTLINICFTMVTGVVIVASVSAMTFMGMLLWNLILDHFE